MPNATAREVELLSKLAFEAHREALIMGLKRVEIGWEGLGTVEREAWREAVRAVLRALK
jgi:hypothetical protein